eukprot:gnl/MRDRNA2_/MRDRNA2_26291_c0_seq1.p1 gnl/MRDRNA2_/MRDRNA2_26291_c0~~gnl/MRDRNA2_/MRDRNA2_26291_c0_seq1.p1  ORF type:complete len:150 (-),score=18.22 gnl/MRDRNA2_/MRDRNA2_26291_c0_seq1:38-487(-)
MAPEAIPVCTLALLLSVRALSTSEATGVVRTSFTAEATGEDFDVSDVAKATLGGETHCPPGPAWALARAAVSALKALIIWSEPLGYSGNRFGELVKSLVVFGTEGCVRPFEDSDLENPMSPPSLSYSNSSSVGAVPSLRSSSAMMLYTC